MIDTEDFRIEGKKLHQYLLEKTIADVVEALIGAFLVDSGFRAAIGFLEWIGMRVDFDVSSVGRICLESSKNLPAGKDIDWSEVEKRLGYTFRHKGLLVQAFTHPSYYKHLGRCYQVTALPFSLYLYMFICIYISSSV